MTDCIEIFKPVIKVLVSEASSLGTINYNMVVFDEVWAPEFDLKYFDLAQNIDDQDNHQPYYLLHSTSTRGEAIKRIGSESTSGNIFSINRVNLDSIILYHCLAYRNTDGFVYLKSGFHSWVATDDVDMRFPRDWDSMDSMNGDCHCIIKIERNSFWRAYLEGLRSWDKKAKLY